MKTAFTFTLVILAMISNDCVCHTTKSLTDKKDSLLTIINNLHKTIDSINLELDAIDYLNKRSQLENYQTVLRLKPKSFIRAEINNPLSKILKQITDTTEVKVKDYNVTSGYFTIISDEKIGYVNEIFFVKDAKFTEYVELNNKKQVYLNKIRKGTNDSIAIANDQLFLLDKETKEKYLKEKDKEDAIKRDSSYSSWVRRFGKSTADQIKEGYIVIGWDKEKVKLSWGEPNDINKTISKYGTDEQWIYNNRSYVYFTNGKVTTIQN